MANINTAFEVKKTGDHEVVVRFPAGITVGESIDANSLLKSMMELALDEEHDVAGQMLCCGVWSGGPKCCAYNTPRE